MSRVFKIGSEPHELRKIRPAYIWITLAGAGLGATFATVAMVAETAELPWFVRVPVLVMNACLMVLASFAALWICHRMGVLR